MKVNTLFLSSILLTACNGEKNKMEITGDWQISTDSVTWNEIRLPGSMASNNLGEAINVYTNWTGGIVDSSYFKSERYAKYRKDDNVKVPFWLQPVKYYKGVAWYKKEITLPDDFSGKDISIVLERCHWETQLWIDGKQIGMHNSLATPHRYDLTDLLTPGKHTLMVRVDNRVKDIDPGENSHSISDHTQGNWNGIVGEMAILKKPNVNIQHVGIYPDVATKEVRIKTVLRNRGDKVSHATLSLEAGDQTQDFEVTLAPGDNPFEGTIRMKGDIRLWDEFEPNLYTLTANLKDNKENTCDRYEERFGFRDFKVTDGKLTINGRPVFLRGTLDCAAFPKTGFPPTDTESWKKIFTACVDHGLNHIRFHSWCPPKAAFIAADEMGLYLEIECSSWANQSTTIGDGRPLDKFIWDESEDIVREYGNHPSFCMMMYGNEPAGQGSNNYLSNFVSVWKERDARRLYSTAGGWPNLPVSDFLSDPNPRLQGWGQGLHSIINAKAPHSDFDWNDYTRNFSQPIISHEIGQWCVYPNFKEIEKYDGVMKAKNFEIFNETLNENGMAHLADSFLLASGKLQALCYKSDIEAALRTKDFGGFQLLGLNDFPGQGTALVGVLDAFWEPKGYVSAEEYKRFCNSTVPLLRVPKFIYANDETLSGKVEIAHYGSSPLAAKSTFWTLRNVAGEVIESGQLSHNEIPVGNGTLLGELNIPLNKIQEPSRLMLDIETAGYKNSWNIWCYPGKISQSMYKGTTYMARSLDSKAKATLQEGGTVLLSIPKGSLSKNYGGDIEIGFSSIFWNTAWTLGQAPHTLGILCNPAHPALESFPTEYHSDYQWWDAMSHSGAIHVGKLSDKITPVVRVIDDWFQNRSLALLFEVNVGKGKLLVSGIDFWSNMEDRLEAQYLLNSLIQYMDGPKFNPDVTLQMEDIENLFDTI